MSSDGAAGSGAEGVPPQLLQHWVHSHEEDAGGVEVYRPVSHPFPPSRGRRGFRLETDGRVEYDAIGATDRPQHLVGRWTADGPGLRLQFDSDGIAPIEIEIVSLQGGKLEVRRR